MKVKILLYTVCILLTVLIQSTILEYFEVFNTKPNLMIVFIICAAFLRGSTEGAVIGFFVGLLHDMLFGTIVGFYALLGMYLGLIVGKVNRKLYRENFLVVIVFVFVFTIFYEALVLVLTSFFPLIYGKISLLYLLGSVVVPEALYNSLISFFIYTIVIKLNYRFEETDRSARKY